MKTETEKEIIEKVKARTDLKRYLFDEFWFNIGFQEAKQENEKVLAKIKTEFTKKMRELGVELNKEEPNIIGVELAIFELNHILAKKIGGKL